MPAGTAIPPAAVGTLRGGAAAGVVVAVLSLVSALTSLDWGPKYGPLAATVAALVPALYGVADQLGGQPGQSGLIAGRDVAPSAAAAPVSAGPAVLDPDVWAEAVAKSIVATIEQLAARPAP